MCVDGGGGGGKSQGEGRDAEGGVGVEGAAMLDWSGERKGS